MMQVNICSHNQDFSLSYTQWRLWYILRYIERLAVDEIILLFRERVIFQEYLCKEWNFVAWLTRLIIWMYTIERTGKMQQMMMMTYTRNVDGVGCKIYADSFFSSPDVIDN
jgi:hypothetical protein